MPEITVVITAYNLEKQLPARLEELAAQSFRNFDLVLLDDCSRDATAELIKKAAQAEPLRIKPLLLEKNLGSPARTRNRALDSGLIDGDYLLFLDGDDALEPSLLETLLLCAKSAQADMAVCAYDRVEAETGRTLCREMRGFPPVLEDPSAQARTAFINTSLWNKLIRAELIGGTRIPDFSVGEDACFLSLLYSKCRRLAFSDELLIHYAVRAGSVISHTSQATVHQFAAELARQLSLARGSARAALGLTAFIHIGISMALRLREDPDIDFKAHLKWTKAYLRENGLLSRGGPVSLAALWGFGVKGLAVWTCKGLYRVGGMGAFLALLCFVTRTLKLDFKF